MTSISVKNAYSPCMVLARNLNFDFWQKMIPCKSVFQGEQNDRHKFPASYIGSLKDH